LEEIAFINGGEIFSLSYPLPLLGEVSSLGNANSSLLYDDR
jgi:hypothetical protein